MENSQEKTAWLVIRIGLAFCFLYAGIGGFINPDSWVGWFPLSMRKAVPETLLLQGWGVYEIITALWFLSGKHLFWPSFVASLSLTGLIVFNLGAMEIIFRDVTILATTIALTVYSYKEKTSAV